MDGALAAYPPDPAPRARAPASKALHGRMAALRKEILAETGGDRVAAERLMRQLFDNHEETGE